MLMQDTFTTTITDENEADMEIELELAIGASFTGSITMLTVTVAEFADPSFARYVKLSVPTALAAGR